MDEHRLLATVTETSSVEFRERLVKMLFEEYNVPSLALAYPSELSALAAEMPSALCLSIGHTVSRAVPIIDGRVVTEAVEVVSNAGREITQRLIHLLMEQEVELTFSAGEALANHMKEEICYVSEDLEEETLRHEATGHADLSYEFPDGLCATIGSPRFQAPETLFAPRVGIHELAIGSIEKCDPTVQELMYQNILLLGGSSLFGGLPERLQREIQASREWQVRIHRPENVKHAVITGGRRFSKTFPARFVPRALYKESGAACVAKKLHS